MLFETELLPRNHLTYPGFQGAEIRERYLQLSCSSEKSERKDRLHNFFACYTMATRTWLLRKSERLAEDAVGEILVKSASEVHWNFSGFFSLPEDEHFPSPYFSFMGEEWRLRCSRHIFDGYETMAFMLEREHSPSCHKLKFRMGIKTENGFEISQIQQHKFVGDDMSAINFLVGRKTPYFTHQVAPEGEITIFCTFASSYIENETSQDRFSKGADKLIESFEELFLSGDHHDIIIKVQDQEIRAHKLIIVVRCPVFATVFRHDTTEKKTGVITIEDCDPEVFREFLSFLYSGKLKNVSAENVIELYAIADKYKVDEMKSDCLEFMMRNMSDETFCDFISLAFRHSERDLLNFATNYFAKNIKTIIVTVKWLSFLKEFPIECNELYIKAINHSIPD